MKLKGLLEKDTLWYFLAVAGLFLLLYLRRNFISGLTLTKMFEKKFYNRYIHLCALFEYSYIHIVLYAA